MLPNGNIARPRNIGAQLMFAKVSVLLRPTYRITIVVLFHNTSILLRGNAGKLENSSTYKQGLYIESHACHPSTVRGGIMT